MRRGLALLAAAILASPALAQPDYTPRPLVEVTNAEWTRDAVLYQLNTRQFTSEGTFAAAQEHLPRLAEMGVDIIWLMPIHRSGRRTGKVRSAALMPCSITAPSIRNWAPKPSFALLWTKRTGLG